jgi:pyridoxamine 5'-phosphate oxidase
MTDKADNDYAATQQAPDFAEAAEPFELFAAWLRDAAARYALGEIPRPPHWSGFCLTPVQIEFWHDRPFRLHDRIVFRRASPHEAWAKTRLYP